MLEVPNGILLLPFILQHVCLRSLNLKLLDVENEVSAWCVHRLNKFRIPKTLIEEISDTPCEAPPIPKMKIGMNLKIPSDLNSIKVVSKQNVIHMLCSARDFR